MSEHGPTTHQKALQINLEKGNYGTFAEIGAGQEVARWFFRVGGAAGTVAKAISAYDMKFSDAIYGSCRRYVSRERLYTMLDHEFALLLERLDADRGGNTRFFVFADTVVARSYSHEQEGQGWMGIRFQTRPKAEPSQIIIHVRLWDKENLQEQETLGILGVNLLYGAMYLVEQPEMLLESLVDNLGTERAEVDMIDFSGPAYHDVDNRLMSLRLVQGGLTNAAMFNAQGEAVQAADVLHNKPILAERGSFRPVTRATMDMLACAQAQFVQEPDVQGGEMVILMEMTLSNLIAANRIDPRDFLDRADILGALGKNVLISNFGEYHRLAAYFFRYTKMKIGLVMGVPTLQQVFEEKYYDDLEGGILESFGRMFKNDLKLYAYPLKDAKTGALITAGNLRVAPHLRHLYAYLLENRFIESLRDVNETCLPIFSRDVLGKIRNGDRSWEEMVPAEVARLIKERRLFSWQG